MSFNGTKLDAIMPPISIFGGRAKKKQLLLERLTEYYDKYSGIVIFLRGDNYAQNKKESVALNIKIDVDISKMLENYSIDAGQTKTIIVERALKEYIEKHNKEAK